MRVHLDRFATTRFGTFGRLRAGSLQLWTLEDPWLNNESGVSCIPPGPSEPGWLYLMLRDTVGRHQHYLIPGVPGRENIELHGGNLARDTRGCVLVGEAIGCLDGSWAILHSQEALRALHGVLGDRTHELSIGWSFLAGLEEPG